MTVIQGVIWGNTGEINYNTGEEIYFRQWYGTSGTSGVNCNGSSGTSGVDNITHASQGSLGGTVMSSLGSEGTLLQNGTSGTSGSGCSSGTSGTSGTIPTLISINGHTDGWSGKVLFVYSSLTSCYIADFICSTNLNSNWTMNYMISPGYAGYSLPAWNEIWVNPSQAVPPFPGGTFTISIYFTYPIAYPGLFTNIITLNCTSYISG
jgi:hypothetical protein